MHSLYWKTLNALLCTMHMGPVTHQETKSNTKVNGYCLIISSILMGVESLELNIFSLNVNSMDDSIKRQVVLDKL